VEWSDHTVTALFFPGSDATIEPARGRRSQ